MRHGLAAIADEMAINHVRAAYSSVVRDILDFSTAVCDGQGRVVAQGLSLALQLGAIPTFMSTLGDSVERPRPGDVYLTNHPWRGGVHLPDFFFARPVFVDGSDEPLAYTVIVSHMVDVGGRYPGGISPRAASLWEEGLVIPPVALVAEHVLNEPLLDLIAANTRAPTTVLGDVRAALAGLEAGAREVGELARRVGVGELEFQLAQMLTSTERATRAEIARLPDGVGTATEFLDEAEPGMPETKIVCRVEKTGSHLRFDFSGTDPQLAAGLNCTRADVVSAVTFVTRAALIEEISVNDGFYRCIELEVPEGTVINARYPAAVGSRGSTVRRIADVAMAALAEVAPTRLPATPAAQFVLVLSGRLEDGRDWLLLDVVHGGWGATASHGGVPGMSHPIVNAANVPVEIIEQDAPVRVVQYGLVAGTAGEGEHAGASAVIREYELLADRTTVDFRLERDFHEPRGASGGGAGARARASIRRRGGEWEDVTATATVVLDAGDRLRAQLAGGGGFGKTNEKEETR